MKQILKCGAILVLIGIGAAATVIVGVQVRYAALIHELDVAPAAPVAIVFGAGVRTDGRLSPMLRDRMDTAITLYQAGKVRKLLVSGDNRFVEYNEPAAMYDYAVARGVPPDDVVRDYAGRRTYDTCYRANAIFGVTDALLVTQRFHLPRALFTCRNLGLTLRACPQTVMSTKVTPTIVCAIPSRPCACGGMCASPVRCRCWARRSPWGCKTRP